MSRAGDASAPEMRGRSEEGQPPNRTLGHALRVLDLFAESSTVLGVSEISRQVVLDKSTVSRIVATLAHHGYVVRSDDGRRYQVGPMAWMLGGRYRLAALLAETSRIALADTLRRFPDTTGYAGVPYRHHVCYVAVVDGPEVQRVHLELGDRIAMPLIALGRVMLAQLPAHELADWLAELSPDQLPAQFPTRGSLLDELDLIRAQGYAINEGDRRPEIGAIAAPVVDPDGALIGGLAIDFWMRDATPELYNELAPAVMTTTVQIQTLLAAMK
jgi:IclR family transcriptional regulator, KDG regulon repressor